MTAPAGGDFRLPGRVIPADRGSLLPALYVSLAGLQAYDGYSTSRGLKSGASEANAVLGTVASHPAALWAVKGGTAFMSIYVAERLWRGHHRGQAMGPEERTGQRSRTAVAEASQVDAPGIHRVGADHFLQERLFVDCLFGWIDSHFR